jgi:hypothetical protein
VVNLSGEVRDQDVFVLGDDDEHEDEVADFNPRAEIPISSAIQESKETDETELTQADLPSLHEKVPSKYYLNRSDTLQGLSLRFGIDVSPIIDPTSCRIQLSPRCTKYANSTISPQTSSGIPISYTPEHS